VNIEVYGKEDCTYCVAAKNLLDSKNMPYTYYDVGVETHLKDQIIERSGGYRKVPQIYIDNEFIAGYDGLRDWLKANP